MHAAAACTLALALHLQPGAHLVETSSFDDRVAWVLPPDRLAAMRKGGFIIDEDKRTSIVTRATVDPGDHLFHLQGDSITTATDVRRHRISHADDVLDSTLSSRNVGVPAGRVDLETAAMADLPGTGVCAGARWRTRLPVMTTLGSGVITIDHTVTHADRHAIVVSVEGSGVISGMEYNLPRLLPGAMSISGTARFDPESGDVTREDYVIRNRLIRTVKDKTIGFLETETVHATTTVTQPPAAPHTHR